MHAYSIHNCQTLVATKTFFSRWKEKYTVYPPNGVLVMKKIHIIKPRKVMEETLMHTAKWKRPTWRGDKLYDSNYTFEKAKLWR